MAVYGRGVMWAGEIYAANYCQNIKQIHAESLAHPNWAAWVVQNETKALALQEVRNAVQEEAHE